MKKLVLINASNLHLGGGLQVATSFIYEVLHVGVEDFDIEFWVSTEVASSGRLVEGLNYLLSFSFYSTLVTMSFFEVDLGSALRSINPLPSSIVDVSDIVAEHKITVFAPYSALGTLGILGYYAVFMYYFVSGVLFKFLFERFPSRYSGFSFCIVIFFITYSMVSLQYNLRTSSRMLVYSVLIYFVFKMLSILFSSVRAK